MENNKQNKLGAGIITISIIQLVFSGFGLIGSIIMLMPSFQEAMSTYAGMSPEQMGISKTAIIIGLISVILIILSVILILIKKAIGVYLYFLITVANIIYSIVMNGVMISSLIGALILPILMAIFVYKKRAIFGIAK